MPRRVSEAGSGTSETLNNTPLTDALPLMHGSGVQPAERVMLAVSVIELRGVLKINSPKSIV
jgi:hypothetical protein